MVDNFKLIREKLVFPNERSFYFIQILKRNKDNPEQKAYSRPIESFYVRSLEHFDRYMPHIIEKCRQNNARAYIKMNPLDMLKVGMRTNIIINQALAKEDWWSVISALNSACGQGGVAEKEEDMEGNNTYREGDVHVKGFQKLWLLDLDDISDNDEENKQFRDEVRDCVNSLEPLRNKKTKEPILNKVMMEIPTKNGYHFLTTSFDMKEFRKKYTTQSHPIEGMKVVDCHKEGNTILYIP